MRINSIQPLSSWGGGSVFTRVSDCLSTWERACQMAWWFFSMALRSVSNFSNATRSRALCRCFPSML